MFRHYLLIAIRNIRRHKRSFFINWIGLSTGLACAFLIYLWVNDEWHFDKFHANERRLYQVMEKNKVGDEIQVNESTQGVLAAAMKHDLPEVEAAVPVMYLKNVGIYLQMRTPGKVAKATGVFAGKDFFRLFSFKLLQGKPEQALAGKNNIVISEALAVNLFGGADKAMGKAIDWEIMGKQEQSVIAGVVALPPSSNSM